jgi:hypothetical protein
MMAPTPTPDPILLFTQNHLLLMVIAIHEIAILRVICNGSTICSCLAVLLWQVGTRLDASHSSLTTPAALIR